MRIRIQQLRIQGFDDQKMKKCCSRKKSLVFFYQSFQFTYPSIKDAQATGKSFSPQKRTSSTSKHEIFYFILFLWIIFALLDPDPVAQINVDPVAQINVGPDPVAQINADPDPKPLLKDMDVENALRNWVSRCKDCLIIYFFTDFFISKRSPMPFFCRFVRDHHM
jgi:hypothetical protein